MSSTDLPRRPGPTTRVRVVEHRREAEDRRREDRVVTEEPLELRLAWPGRPAQRAWLTLRTPGHDFELAAGWALHEGLLPPAGIDRVAYCTDATLAPEQEFNVVTLTLAQAPVREPADRVGGASAGSACGVCGSDQVDRVLSTRAAPWTGPWLTEGQVLALPELLAEHQAQFSRTGGSHAAALVGTDGSLVVVREDVGRHNALDKVTGARLLAQKSPAGPALVTSGRAGFELVQKAAAAGVGALVAIGAPTSLSVAAASAAGVRLYGFTRGDRTVRYC